MRDEQVVARAREDAKKEAAAALAAWKASKEDEFAQMDAMFARLERRETRERLEADAKRVYGSASESASGVFEPKVVSFVGQSAESVREAASARGVDTGVIYALTGSLRAYIATKLVAMDMA